MITIIKKLIRWLNSFRYYVIADPLDNSVTLSRQLFQHIKDNAKAANDTSLFVFYIPSSDTYGFMQDHGISQPTQLCDIQYNDKHKCIGFESLCPSVGAILYHYGLPADHRVKLSVSIHTSALSKIYYQFEKPDAKYIRKYQKG